jgi:tRNA dimethylallyltransferase
MVAGGLVDEVVRLRAAGALSRTASKALGYAEVIAHLDGACSLDDAIAATVLHTRQFAVRQERWFRRDPRIRWIDVTDDPVREVAPFVLQALAR